MDAVFALSVGDWSHQWVVLVTPYGVACHTSICCLQRSSGSSAQQRLLVLLAYHTILQRQQKDCVISKQHKISCTALQAVAFSRVYNNTG